MERADYYGLNYVKMALTELLWRREMTVIGKYRNRQGTPKRTVRAISVKDLYTLDRLKGKLIKFDQNHSDIYGDWTFNLYRSVARYSKIPEFTYNPRLRSKVTRVWYKSLDRYKLFKGYDMFLDFDLEKSDVGKSEMWTNIKDTITSVKEMLDDSSVPYQVFFSGVKGFHMLIPHRVFPKKFHFNSFEGIRTSIFNLTKVLVEDIKERYDNHSYGGGSGVKGFIDLSNNGSNSKLMKCPLSLSELDLVAMPLSDQMLKRFRHNQMRLDYVMDNWNIRQIMKKNYYMRYDDQSDEESRKNFSSFINKYL